MANELDLLEAFRAGEVLVVQRTVQGKNVLMVMEVRGTPTLALGVDKVILHARLKTWGVSSYADERVDRQHRAIERLLKHLQNHCTDSDCPHRGEEGTS